MHKESTTSADHSLTLSEQESSAISWLKRVSKAARGKQLQVFVVRLGQLAAQVCAFWFFSVLAQRVVVEQQAVFFNQLTPFILAAGVWAFCAWLADTLSYKAKFAIESTLEQQVHEVLKTKQTAIARKYSSTYWQQLMLTNLNDVGDFLTQYSVQKWISGLAPLVVILVILPVNYLVALALLLTMPIVPLFMILVGKGAAQLHRKHFVALERLGDMFSDRLKGLSLITATCQHPHQLTRLDKASKVVNRKTMNVVSVAFLSSTVLDFFSTVSIALVAVFIGFTMLGELSIGPSINLNQGLFMLLVAPLLFAELRMLGKLYHQKAKAEAGAERFEAVLKESTIAPVSPCSGEFSWINFRVDAPALHADQLNVKKGDWIRLTGASGSGKTSLLEALMGFREASHALADDAALLSQQTYVLDNTLAFNLHLGAEGYADEHLVQVLSDVGLQDWYASLPDGLATELGDYPAMSGGEAQRLALARILLLQKDIVLLDEPTAHLTETLHTQLATLIHDQLRDKTVIWASHKPLPEAWFDQQWMISEGQIEVRY